MSSPEWHGCVRNDPARGNSGRATFPPRLSFWQPLYTLFTIAVVVMLLIGRATGSGFFNSIQSASSDSVATAGQTAAAEDASTIFYNVAGMALLPRAEGLATTGIIFPGSSFQNNGSKDLLGDLVTGSSNTNPQPFVFPGL